MSVLAKKEWHNFWNDQSTPCYRKDTDGFQHKYGAELGVLLQQAKSYWSVLDLGCGNGALYQPLEFNDCDYTGVDFSESLLNDFRNQHPSARVLEANAAEYCEDRQYDLIFSSGLIQYFPLKSFEHHLENCRRMMSDNSTIVHSGIPWARQKWLFRSGWGAGVKPPAKNKLKHLLRPLYSMYKERIGRWYSQQEIAALAEKHGLKCQFFGSLMYTYRFHVVMSIED